MRHVKAKMEDRKRWVYRVLKEDGHKNHASDIAEYVISVVIVLNVVLIIAESFKEFVAAHHALIRFLDAVFFLFFLTEYLLRLWIADITLRDKKHPIKSRIHYIFSFTAMINLLALIPVLSGNRFFADFRIFRVLRLLRIATLRKFNRYSGVLVEVVRIKAPQLFSSLFILFVLMLMASVLIFDLEHEAQPYVFENALSGLWWSVSTLTTVGYGDIYPITPLGRALGSFVSLLGVGIVAIPTGIISSGFFEVSGRERKRIKKVKKMQKAGVGEPTGTTADEPQE